MPRIARIVAVDYPHHITQRGNYKQTVFTASAEYLLFIEALSITQRTDIKRPRQRIFSSGNYDKMHMVGH
jgi:REP element-mobilizing transposase RayT